MANSTRNRLMIPGPVEVDPAVLEALSAPVEPHYGAVWVEKYFPNHRHVKAGF